MKRALSHSKEFLAATNNKNIPSGVFQGSTVCRRKFLSTSHTKIRESPRIETADEGFPMLGALALGGSVILGLGGAYFATSSSFTDSASLSSKQQELKLNAVKRFPSFSTKQLDKELSMSLVASVVAETISKSTLHERYDILSSLDDPLGDGAFGRVFKGRDKLTGKEVAIKSVPHRVMTADAVFNEVDVLRRVRGHENIIHLYQVLNCDKKYFIVSELCSDGELLDVLQRKGPYPEHSAARLASKLSSALQHIHRCGFIHADIKPENIVFSREIDEDIKFNENCRIIDFGVAKEIGDFKNYLSKGKPELCMGTLAYAPPEIIKMSRDKKNETDGEVEPSIDLNTYDPRSADMWALGVVLFISLMGCHPFDVEGEGDEEAVLSRILEGKVPFDVHGSVLELSEEAKSLLKGLLEPDPSHRLSAEQVLKHPFVIKHSNENIRNLPSSWVEDGFEGSSFNDRSLINKMKNDSSYDLFFKKKSVDAFVVGMLIAALVGTSLPPEKHLGSKYFRKRAFDIIDKNRDGLLSKKDLAGVLNFSAEDDSEKLTDEGATIDYDSFRALLRRAGCVSRRFKKGQALFSEGAKPQGFYVLTKGRCGLEYTFPEDSDEQNHNSFFHVAEAGSLFGESALDQGRQERAVTIRALEASEVSYIPKRVFFRALARSPALQTKIFEAARLQQAKRLRDLINRLLEEKGETLQHVKFKQGDFLYRAGDAPQGLYFIESGLLAAYSEGTSKDDCAAGPLTLKLAQRGKHDVTGSSVFFQKGKRYSSAQCMTDVEVALLKKSQIEELLGDNRPLQFYLESQAQWRMEQWNQRLAEVERGVTEPQLLPLLLQFVKTNGIHSFAKAVTEMNVKKYNAGEAVFTKGEACDKFFIVDEGTAVAEISTSSGDAMAVAQFEPGDHFGEQELLEGRDKHSVTVRCVVPCSILSMDRNKFVELVQSNEPFASAIGKAARMRQHRWGKNLLVLARSDEKTSQHSNSKPLSEAEDKAPEYRHTAMKDVFHKLLVKKRYTNTYSIDVNEEFNPFFADQNDESKSQEEADYDVELVELSKGEVLFQAGAPSDAVYYIHAGELQYLPKKKQTENETDRCSCVERELQPGDTLGLDSVGDNVLQDHSCICASDKCYVSKIPKATMEHLIRNHQYVSDNLKRHFLRTAPLRDLEKSVHDNITQSRKLKEESAAARFFSTFDFFLRKASTSPKKNTEYEQPTGTMSYSQVMQELSRS